MITRENLEARGLLNSLTKSVYDPAFTELLAKMPWNSWYQESSDPLDCRHEYLETYRQWILKTELNSITGLERFKRLDLINGTTQTFDEAYFKYADRRLRLFRGEYAYHRRIHPSAIYLEDQPLAANDYVILSAPFCSTGEIHPGMKDLLDKAAELKVPVILDCAFFGTCYGLHFDFSHPAIESVSFSLTKGCGLGHVRSGIRFSNLDDNFPICQQNNFNHSILGAARIGLHMMQNLGPDFIPRKYQNVQKELCAELKLKPSACVHIAAGDESWDQYKIDALYNRVGLSELIKAHRKGLL